MMLEKEGFNGFTGSLWKIGVRYEFDFKIILNGLVFKQKFLRPFLIEFPSNNEISYLMSLLL